MLFNSYVFLFAFLPVALAGFYALSRLGRRPAAVWLVLASLVFYGWWDPRFVVLLVGSIAFNYTVSELLGRAAPRPRLQSAILAAGISGDLLLLAYFKYLYTLLSFLAAHGITDLTVAPIVLPLGISFFTFTQIGYLVDVKQGVAKERGLLNYVLFVTFFPHLIAGPILHNREMMPQFTDASVYRFSGENFCVGATIFVIGLVKKCAIADPLSPAVGAIFAHPAGQPLALAWYGVLAYSMQLYFDFSGYSDMAIGLARMFNLRFPLNFNSPFKATSVIDYWQRWHMTLTRYLTLYLFSPIALWVTRRRAAARSDVSRNASKTPGGFTSLVAFPTLVTMTLAGVWHGAGLQFIAFGVLHGVYITINHAWRIFGPKRWGRERWPVHAACVLLTYLCACLGFLFFRAPSLGGAFDLLGGLLGAHGTGGAVPLGSVVWLAVLYVVVWLLPNTQQIMVRAQPALGRILPGPFPVLQWRMTLPWAMAVGVGALAALLSVGGTTEFLYFQF
ncbi:MAG: MBOAT family protein [Acetobacteraceae bacterium]|nr:MBOAT family protein [Acetobacteraceae bacterium]